jgi:zinc protease
MAGNSSSGAKIYPYKYHINDLQNGLRVIVIPTSYPNIVSLQIPVQTGSRNEVEPGKSGFAHFFEHMMFRGTEKFPADKYTELLKNAGADQNAYTSDDYTNYHITFSKDDLETILMLEADRFQNLQYSVEDFKTEAKAVLGEYNKNSASPIQKLYEMQRNSAFEKHTYKHTTMGFIEDIEDMPNQYDYSLKFFSRYYRPEKTIVILCGDLEPANTFGLVEKYWGNWRKGGYSVEIPEEPEPSGSVYEHVKWTTETLPWISVAFHGPAFSDSNSDKAIMDVIAAVAFSTSSELYQKLVVKEQKVDIFNPYFPDRTDANLLTIFARVKDIHDIWYVRDEILKTFATIRTEQVSSSRLAEIKANLKYTFANSLDNSESIAAAMVASVARTRDPESINRVYALYDAISTDDVMEKANHYFGDDRLVVATLSEAPLPDIGSLTGSIDDLVRLSQQPLPAIATVLNRSDSPIINFRILFNTGAAFDPAGKEGLAQLTANMISSAGSKTMSYEAIEKALFPMAATFNNQVDKEMTVFMGTTHADNLNNYYKIISQQLLQPAWDESDFSRNKSNLINQIKVDLRGDNEEELGKEVLYEMIYRDHPYGHLNLGHVNAIEKLTLADVQDFYKTTYTRKNLVLAAAGNISDDFLTKIKRDLADLPEGAASAAKIPAPVKFDGFHAEIIQKDTRATAVSFGFAIPVNRSHEDFAALWLARSYLGEHRSQNSQLYQRIREIRGMNYGDYAYIEYFPRGMFQFQPDPNLGRSQQIFQIWLRPLESNENAHFATRVAMYELDRLLRNGMTEADFTATRNYLLKFVNILTKTQDRQLGYALDSRYYNIGAFSGTITEALQKLTVHDVNRIIKKYLQQKNIKFVYITRDAEDLKKRLVNNTTSKLTYQAQKPDALLQEDKKIQDYKLNFSADKIIIRPVEEVFTN